MDGQYPLEKPQSDKEPRQFRHRFLCRGPEFGLRQSQYGEPDRGLGWVCVWREGNADKPTLGRISNVAVARHSLGPAIATGTRDCQLELENIGDRDEFPTRL